MVRKEVDDNVGGALATEKEANHMETSLDFIKCTKQLQRILPREVT